MECPKCKNRSFHVDSTEDGAKLVYCLKCFYIMEHNRDITHDKGPQLIYKIDITPYDLQDNKIIVNHNLYTKKINITVTLTLRHVKPLSLDGGYK